MSAKVFNFDEARRRAKEPKKAPTPEPPVKRPITLREIFNDVYEDVIGEWQSHATRNKLSEYIESKIPKAARFAEGGDYVNDLNILSHVEGRLAMKVAIFYPGTTLQNTYGWLVAFHRGKDVFSTPPDMASEANARALNILLFLEFEKQLKRLERDTLT